MSARPPHLSGTLARVLPYAAALLAPLLALLAALALPAAQPYDLAAEAGPPALGGFWPAETSGGTTYRWTDGDSTLRLYGLEGAAASVVTLRLTGAPAEQQGATPLTLAFHGSAVQVKAAPGWRVYRVLLPAAASGWAPPELRLSGPTRRAAPGDSREIGVALASVSAVPAAGRSAPAVLVRAAFLLALAAALALWLWRASPRPLAAAALLGALLLAALAGAVDAPAAAWRLPLDWGLVSAVALGAAAAHAPWLLAAALRSAPERAALGATTMSAGFALVAFDTLSLAALALTIGGGLLATRGAAEWLEGGARATTTPATRDALSPPPSLAAHPTRRSLLLALPLTLALALVFLPRLDDMRDYHNDEGYWIGYGSRAFSAFFVERDFDSPVWFDGRLPYMTPHPQLAKYVIGAGPFFAGYERVPVLAYDWRYSVEWNRERGLFLGEPVVAAGRFGVALAAVAAGVLLYWLVALLAGPWCGLLTVGLAVAGRLMVMSGRRAAVDMPGLCLALLALVCLVYAVQALRAGRPGAVGWMSATGVACGLAVSAKLTFALFGAVCVAALAHEAWAARRRGQQRWYAPLVGCGLVALWSWAVFYLTNPFLYHQPLAGTLHILGFLREVAATPVYPTPQLPQKVAAVWESMARYGALGWNGLPGDRPLILLGISALIAGRRCPLAPRPLAPVVLWLAVVHGAITLSLPGDIDRYYLPLQPGHAFLQAYGLVWAAGQVASWRARRA